MWLHPAFAAEFADPFIAGTPFEGSALHISIEVLTLALDELLKEGGVGAELEHATRAALNTAGAQLRETRKLAHKLAHARKGGGQERAFFSAVSKALDELEPGGVLMLPWDGEVPLLLVLRRGLTPEHELHRHRRQPVAEGLRVPRVRRPGPPKLKFRTCLELGEVPLAKLADEAWWVVLWFGMGSTRRTRRRAPQARPAPDPVRGAAAVPDGRLARPRRRQVGRQGRRERPDRRRRCTLRRSRAATTAAAATRCATCCSAGVGEAQCRHASLLLRLQMLRLAQHDLQFVQHIDGAERTVLGLARRQLAHKAAKLGEQRVISLERMGAVRRELGELDEALKAVAGPPDQTAPPLVLCAADAHLGRPSLEALLSASGYDGTGGLLPPPGGAPRSRRDPGGRRGLRSLLLRVVVPAVRRDDAAARAGVQHAAAARPWHRAAARAAGQGGGRLRRVPDADAVAVAHLRRPPARQS